MKFLLQITTRDVPHSEALESHVRQKAEKLETFYPHIMGCRVVIEIPHKHKHQGRMFNVRLDITVPGNELVVNRDANIMRISTWPCATPSMPPGASLKTTAAASGATSRRTCRYYTAR